MTRLSPVAGWLVSRLGLLVMFVLPRVGGRRMSSDMVLYERWGSGIADWSSVPYRDFGWEYPPGAAAVLTPPAFAGDAYPVAFVVLMLLADAAILAVLLRLAGRLGSARGPWLWVGGVLLMGPLILARYDAVSALLALLALLAVVAGAPVAAGVALGGGFVTKLWPAVLLAVAAFAEGRRRLLAAFGATVALTIGAVLAVGGAAHGAETFERHTGRGLQSESVAATPLVVAKRLGAAVDIAFFPTSGSWDVTGTGAALALAATSVATLAAVALAGWLAWRARHAPELWLDVAAVALLLLAVTGKVLSPQYFIWLLALLAAALCRRGSPLGRPAVLVALAGAFGQVVYPVYFTDLIRGDGVVVVVALVLRNALLVAATALATRAVWRAAVSR